jgi:hypothetical protein
MALKILLVQLRRDLVVGLGDDVTYLIDLLSTVAIAAKRNYLSHGTPFYGSSA